MVAQNNVEKDKATFKDFLLCFMLALWAVSIVVTQKERNRIKTIEEISGYSYEEWLEKAEACKVRGCVIHFDFGDKHETND